MYGAADVDVSLRDAELSSSGVLVADDGVVLDGY